MAQLQTDQAVMRQNLREVERKIEVRTELHERSIAAAQQRIQELDERARAAAERVRLAEVAKPGPREVQVEQPTERYEDDALAASEEKLLEVNEVTAEELRLQGLSVMQAVRFVAQRDRMGGFCSIDDVEQVEGIPYDTLLDLKSRSAV